MKSKIIVIIGPTACGKTKLSIALAKQFNAEIINADSVQIYKEANIASGKITELEKENIVHHMLDIKSLDELETIYDYQKEGRKILDQLISQNKNVIIIGGSGLYIKALLYDYNFDYEIKNNNDFIELTNEKLKEKVDKLLPNNDIHVNNRKRLVRFLNKYEIDHKIIKNEEGRNNKIYDFTLIGLTTSKDILKLLINKRVDQMIESGIIAETNKLKKYDKIKTIIGYKEILSYINGEITIEEAIERIKRNTYKYSKRQYTFFLNQFKDINWFNVNINDFDKTIEEVIKLINLLP